jgi:hypothetical protein
MTTAPTRIQRKRTKGWRMPANAVSVTRPGRWGNPFPITAVRTRDECLRLFESYATIRLVYEPDWLDPLRGKTLACWCRVGDPCHADMLLRWANAEVVRDAVLPMYGKEDLPA